jgi:GrpB-like predicted nucleotidyltransferase (UPF0157 family)
MPEPIVVSDYDPAWPGRYASLRQPVAAALGELASEIQHVGSTAVPGLAAKPTIDICVLLRSAGDLPAAIERLAEIGYAHEGDFGVTGREAFATPPGCTTHDHHLYVCHPGWPGWRHQLAFRDYLRAHFGAACAYAALKRTLAALHRDDRAAYTNSKAAFVSDILKRAATEGGA